MRRSSGMLAALVAVAALAPAPAHASHRAPARCSRHTPDAVGLSRWRATRRILVPRGAAAVRLCRYSGMNDDPPLALVRSVVRRRPNRIVRRLDALRPPQGSYACPNDDLTEIVAHFAYPGGRRLRVDVGLSGCRIASNGRRGGFAALPPGPRLLRLLRRLTE